MADESVVTGKRHDGGKGVQRRHFMATAVLTLGLLSIALLTWTNRINERGNAHFYLANELMDLQISTAKSYLELDGVIRGNRALDGEGRSDINRAFSLCHALLNGGRSEYGPNLQPLRDPELRVQVEGILRMLTELKTLLEKRSWNREQADLRTNWERHSDEVCAGILQKAEALEIAVEKELVAENANSLRRFYGILLIWVSVVVAATTGLWSRESQRRAAEAALLKANANLECQTEELLGHREHLSELVEKRTKDLKTANSALHNEVAERRQAEEALRKSEEQYRRLVETMNEGLTVLDDKGVLSYVNDKFCSMLGYSREELLGQRSVDFVLSEGDRKIVEEQLDRIRRRDRGRYEVTFRKKDGQKVITRVSPEGIYDTDGNVAGCFAVISDITEKIALQKESVRTAHLVSLGEMAAGVAHEINNPTNGIINYAQILSNEFNGKGSEHDIADRILKEGRRIAEIVRGLLLFARGGKREKIQVHLSEILANSLNLTGSQLRKEGIEILNAVPPDLPELIADPQEIQQVFMNIISNARYALNQKYPGKHENKILRINADKRELYGSLYVRIEFLDHGVGIPSAIIDKVREPFFSAKPRGKGTGLGLSISDGIVNEHGGRLAIESVEGEFTNVVIELPTQRRNNAQNTGC